MEKNAQIFQAQDWNTNLARNSNSELPLFKISLQASLFTHWKASPREFLIYNQVHLNICTTRIIQISVNLAKITVSSFTHYSGKSEHFSYPTVYQEARGTP